MESRRVPESWIPLHSIASGRSRADAAGKRAIFAMTGAHIMLLARAPRVWTMRHLNDDSDGLLPVIVNSWPF